MNKLLSRVSVENMILRGAMPRWALASREKRDALVLAAKAKTKTPWIKGATAWRRRAEWCMDTARMCRMTNDACHWEWQARAAWEVFYAHWGVEP